MSSTTVVLSNATDTYINQGAPSANAQSVTRVALRATTGQVCYGYFYFSRPFPLGATIISATLKVYSNNATTGSNTWTLKKLTSAFQVSKATWNVQPTVTATDSKALTKSAPAAKTEWAFDVKTHMQAVSAGAKWYGWRLETNVSGQTTWINSAQAASLKPVLEIVYSEAPSAPSTLTPSGGRVVGVSQPVLQFDFTDKAGNTSLSAVRVQMNSVDSWTAPTFDSRAVAATTPQLDLTQTFSRTATIVTNTTTAITSVDAAFQTSDVGSTITGTGIPAGATIASIQSATAATLSAAATASGTITGTINESYAGLAAGATIFWRVQTQDGSGQWSDWSKSTSFTYQTQGTLAITQPTGSTVSDPTPPIWWSLTGRTQAAYEVLVKDNTGKQIYTSGKTSGTATAFTIPSGVIKTDTQSYTLMIRTWDNQDRVTTPTSTNYVEQSLTVTYAYSATVAPVVGLTAVLDSNSLNTTLTWTRSAAPDSYVIRRNGVVIKDNILPQDIFVSGTTYSYVDYTSVPRKVNQYTVQAVTNSVTSASNPTASVTPNPQGIWLQDSSRSISVQIVGVEDGSWDLGAVESVYSPVGASTSMVVTQSLRGYEGEISGSLMDIGNGRTVATQEANMWLLKSTPGQTYNLTLSDLSIPVVIYNVRISPTPTVEITKDVAFNFIQVGNLPFTAVV